MPEPKHQISNVSSFVPESLGEPGQRTFRIVVFGEGNSAIVWLEKEQLFQLALAIRQFIASSDESDDSQLSPTVISDTLTFVKLDFKAAKMAMRYDVQAGVFLIDAYSPDDDIEDITTLRVWIDTDIATGFSNEAMRICASGRPLCLLCGDPIDPTGHPCAKVNGHVTIDDDI